MVGQGGETSLPVVVCLPAVRVELCRICPGPVIERHGGPSLYIDPGEQSLPGTRDLRLQDLHQLGLVRVRGGWV